MSETQWSVGISTWVLTDVHALYQATDSTYTPSIVSKLLGDYPDASDAQAIRNVGAIIYAAGADTVRLSGSSLVRS